MRQGGDIDRSWRLLVVGSNPASVSNVTAFNILSIYLNICDLRSQSFSYTKLCLEVAAVYNFPL